jgi:hypothetical protein
MGDLDGDFDHDLEDFLVFRTIFNAENGAGSFAAMLGVPEPSALALVIIAGAVWHVGTARGRCLWNAAKAR